MAGLMEGTEPGDCNFSIFSVKRKFFCYHCGAAEQAQIPCKNSSGKQTGEGLMFVLVNLLQAAGDRFQKICRSRRNPFGKEANHR
jgi:hypothetical protein